MANQAAKLKEIVNEKNREAILKGMNSNARTIAVASGKGGVGKSTFTANFAYHLSKIGKKVLVIDSDIGMANLDILLGVQPSYDLGHLLRGECSLEDALVEGPAGIKLLSGITGDDSFINVQNKTVHKLMNIGAELEKDFDFVLIDLGAGASQNIISTILAAEELIMILTTEPTSIMDSYSLIKILSNHDYKRSVNILINQSEKKSQADKISKRMKKTVARYLELELDVLGIIAYDRNMSKAVHKQELFCEIYKNSDAAKEIERIAYQLTGEKKQRAGIKSYFFKMLGFLKKNN